MKRPDLLRITSLWLLFLSGGAFAGTTLMPVVVSTKGKVTMSRAGAPATPVADKQAVAVGSELMTGGSSAALISLAPGLSALMKDRTTIQLKAAEVGSGSRYAEVELVTGSVVCSLKKQGSLKQKYRLVMGKGEYAEAVGTVWQCSRDGNKKSVAVLDGTVSWTGLPGGAPISLPAGTVLLVQDETVNGIPTLASVSVVNLVTGMFTSYPLDGSAPVTTPATSAQLSQARDVFNEAVGHQFDNLDSGQKAALLSLLFNANKTLAQAGVAPITTPGGGGGGGGGGGAATVTSNNPADATSPITP